MEEQSDLNKAQVVTEQDLNKADVVNQADLNKAGSVDQQKQDETLADGSDPNKTVPYSKLKEAADARKKAEEDAAFAQRQVELLRAQMQGQQVSQQTAQTTLDQAMLNCQVTADEMYGEAQIRVLNEKSRLDGLQMQAQQAMNANQQFVNAHPDFTQVVGSVNPTTGQIMSLSQEAATLLQKKPHLANASFQAAYEEVLQERKFKDYESKAAVNQEHLIRQGVDTSTQPLGGSAAGGGGAGDPNNQKMMTREQVTEMNRKLDAGEEIT